LDREGYNGDMGNYSIDNLFGADSMVDTPATSQYLPDGVNGSYQWDGSKWNHQ
jgi:hypothetical protein